MAPIYMTGFRQEVRAKRSRGSEGYLRAKEAQTNTTNKPRASQVQDLNGGLKHCGLKNGEQRRQDNHVRLDKSAI
jgi:hypothetical protein